MPIFCERQAANMIICNNNAMCSLSKSAHNAISGIFAFFNAVRFYSYCIFYYYGAGKLIPQRT